MSQRTVDEVIRIGGDDDTPPTRDDELEETVFLSARLNDKDDTTSHGSTELNESEEVSLALNKSEQQAEQLEKEHPQLKASIQHVVAERVDFGSTQKVCSLPGHR